MKRGIVFLAGLTLSISLMAEDIIIDRSEGIRKGVIFDKEVALMWQDNNNIIRKDWDGAKAYCKALNLNGDRDWYLPNVEELKDIFDTSKERDHPDDDYWSISNGADSAFSVYIDGRGKTSSKKNIKRVRCIREYDPSDTLSFDSLVSDFMDKKLEALRPPSEIKLVKDEFETSKEFDARVAKAKAEQKTTAEKYQKEYEKSKIEVKRSAIKNALEMTWGRPLLSGLKYDADNGYFIADIRFEAKKAFEKKIAIRVDRSEARAFKEEFSNLRAEAVFDYDGESVRLKDIRVPYKKKVYTAQFTDMKIDDTRVAVNLKNDYKVEPSSDLSIKVAASEVSTFDASKLISLNDLDKLLAKAPQTKTDKTKWLFVIGIEQYQYTDNISYAKRSAEMFVKTAQKTLGVPQENSYVMLNDKASQAEIKTNLKKMLRRVQSGDSIYFYYNGHGVPVPSQKNEPYLLASNTEPDFVQDEKFFSLQNIYSTLSDSKAGKVVAVVDSCFSGVTDGKAVLKGVAATRVVAKRTSFDPEKMVVMSAGKGHQYSNAYEKKGHRLFSFYVMKNLLEGKSDVASLYKETKAQTYETSLQEYGDLRVQEPTIEGNSKMVLR